MFEKRTVLFVFFFFKKKALELNTAIDIHSNITQGLCNLTRIMVGPIEGFKIMVYKNVFANFRVIYGHET